MHQAAMHRAWFTSQPHCWPAVRARAWDGTPLSLRRHRLCPPRATARLERAGLLPLPAVARNSRPGWDRCSSSSAGRRGCGSPFHSTAVHPAQRSSGTRSPPGSGCRRSVLGATSSPWQSRPEEGGRMWLKALACHRRPDQRSEGPRAHLPPPPLPRLHHLPSDGLLAGPADPFGNRGDPKFVQVRLQAPQHAVQLAPRLGGPSWGRAAPRLPLRHELWRERAGQVSQGLGAVSHSTGGFSPTGQMG